MTKSEDDPMIEGADGRKWREVRVKRRRRKSPKNPLLAWLRERRRRIRLWLVICAAVIAGFSSFVIIKNYLEGAAAGAAQIEVSSPR